MSDTHAATPVAIADRGAVRVITVDRPDKLNALNAATLDALHQFVGFVVEYRTREHDDAIIDVDLNDAGV